jgi:dTDP-4-amino-4,6-dideoxygalactose transaminase
MGYKANYTDLQAAIGRVQLARQPEFAPRREAVARLYTDRLGDLGLGFQADVNAASHARHLFFVILPAQIASRRPAILSALRGRGIGASVHYPPLHRMPLYASFGPCAQLPGTESVVDRIITLPIGASVTIADAERVAAALREAVA